MDTSDAHDLVEDLGASIDSLEAALKPLLEASVNSNAANLPSLDKARLYTWTSYAVESLIFSYLNLSGVEGKSHPVFTELKRVQQYMHKIELAQNPEYGKRDNMSLDKAAAGRFIRAGLAGNDKYDNDRAQREAEQIAGAKRKLDALDNEGSALAEAQNPQIKKHEKQQTNVDVGKAQPAEASGTVIPGLSATSSQAEQTVTKKKKKKDKFKRKSAGKNENT